MANTGSPDAAQTLPPWQQLLQLFWASFMAGAGAPSPVIAATLDWKGMALVALGVILVLVALVQFMSEETARRVPAAKTIAAFAGKGEK